MRSGILAVVVALSLSACTKAQNTQLVATSSAVHSALAAADDKVRAVCQDDRLAQACADVRPPLREALAVGLAFSKAVEAQQPSQLPNLLEAVGKLTTEVKKLPDSQTAQIMRDLAKSIAEAYALMGGRS